MQLLNIGLQQIKKGEVVLSVIHSRFPEVKKKSTISLSVLGPAPVFEAEWDLKGALQTHYKDSTLKADIVTPRLEVEKKGLKTTIYTFSTTYPYQNLYIYNFKNNSIHNISNSSDAKKYFQNYNPDLNNGCPPPEAGNGVAIFSKLL